MKVIAALIFVPGFAVGVVAGVSATLDLPFWLHLILMETTFIAVFSIVWLEAKWIYERNQARAELNALRLPAATSPPRS